MAEASNSYHLLLVDDQIENLGPVVRHLVELGYDVTECGSVDDARFRILANPFDVAVLDVDYLPLMLIERIKSEQRAAGMEPFVPEEGAGFGLANWIRSTFPDIGVIMMSSQQVDSGAQIEGYNQGADAYFVKNDGAQLLAAMVRSVISRRRLEKGSVATFDGFVFNMRLRKLVSPSGLPINLTDAEFRLLEFFVNNPGLRLERNDLHMVAFNGTPNDSDRAVDTLVSKLRRKMYGLDVQSSAISTIHGVGYRLDSIVSFRRE